MAVSNTDRTLVTPLTTIQREKFTQDAQALLKLYDERACVGLIVGLPLHMHGGDGRRAQSSRSFVTNLLRLRDLPVAYQDERLSTFAATLAGPDCCVVDARVSPTGSEPAPLAAATAC